MENLKKIKIKRKKATKTDRLLASEFKRPDYLGRYKVKVIIIKDGLNDHYIRRVNSFPFDLKTDEKQYTIKANALFEAKKPFLTRLQDRLKLISNEFLILFRDGESDPIIRWDSAITPEVLYTTRSSRAITGMIKEWFSGGRKFPMNKWVFILVTATIGTIIYAKMTGRI